MNAALKRNGISRERQPPGRRAQAGKGASNGSGTRRNKAHLVEAFEHLLGTVPDADVAEMAGVNETTVANYRSRAGVAAYRRPKQSKANQKRKTSNKKRTSKWARSSKIDGFVALLGQMLDRVVVEKAGVTPAAVQHCRARRGILAFGRRMVAPEAEANARAPGAAEASPNGLVVWRVTLEPGEVMAVAAGELQAEAARTAGLGSVLSLERVGPLR